MRTFIILVAATLACPSLQYSVDPDVCKGKEEYDEIKSDNRCLTCYCVNNGERLSPMCDQMICSPCPGVTVDDGTCCGRCRNACMDNGKMYGHGELISNKDPCKKCVCYATGRGRPQTYCTKTYCDQCPGRVEPDNTCCGHCIPGECLIGDTIYKEGEVIQSMKDCATCYCRAGKAECTTVQCPNLDCKLKDQYRSPDSCCPECKCKVKRHYYNPGEQVGDKCDGCVCRNGTVECNPSICPPISCVDPVLGDDCCYTCPNGVTCAAGKNTIIKKGEFKKIKSSVCMCLTDPWFPNAFCAHKKISKSLFKGLENQVVNFNTY